MTKKEQNEMIACLPAGLVKSSSLTDTQKKVLAAIYSKRHTEQYTANGFWFINNEELAKEAGLDPKSGTLRYTLSRLIDLNLINRKPGLNGRRGVSSEYSINEEGVKQLIEKSKKRTGMKPKRQHPNEGKNNNVLEEKIEKLTLRIEQFFDEIKEQNDKNTALLTALLNKLNDSELEKGSKRAVKRAVSCATLPSDTDTESDTLNTLISNILTTHAYARENTNERPEGGITSNEKDMKDSDCLFEDGTLPLTQDSPQPYEDKRSCSTYSVSDASAEPGQPQRWKQMEDVVSEEEDLNTENTTSAEASTYPQPDEKIKEKDPAPPRGDVAPTPSTPQTPQNAQNRHESDDHPSSGTVAHPEEKNRSESEYEGLSVTDFLKEQAMIEREELEWLDAKRGKRKVDVSDDIKKFNAQCKMLYDYSPANAIETLKTVRCRANNIVASMYDKLGGENATDGAKDMIKKMFEQVDSIWAGKEKYIEKMKESGRNKPANPKPENRSHETENPKKSTAMDKAREAMSAIKEYRVGDAYELLSHAQRMADEEDPTGVLKSELTMKYKDAENEAYGAA